MTRIVFEHPTLDDFKEGDIDGMEMLLGADKAPFDYDIAAVKKADLLKRIKDLIENGNKQPRWPKGHPNGGQWKPTGAGGIGGGQGSMFDNPYLKAKMKEAESALGEAKGLLGAGVATAGAGLAGTAGAVIGGKVGQAIGEKAAEGLGLTATHAQPGPGGKPITITQPSKASPPETWRDSKAAATWTPKSEVPDHINGTPVKPWKAPKTDAEWNAVEGQMTLPEPPLPQALDTLGKPKRPGAGVVITEPDGRVWIVKPTNEFGGYKHSYPKGGKESGIPSLQANAIKEAWEESGLKVEINGILGDYEGDTSIARYYTASRTGGSPADMGWETQATLLVPASELKTYLNRSRDREIADDLVARLGRTVGKSDIAKRIYALMEAIELEKGDPNQPRWPKGHPRGGQWKPTGAGGVGGAGATGGAAGLPKEPFKPSFATGANPNNGALKAANKAIQKYADMANAGDVTGLLAAKPTDPGTVKGPNSYMKKKWGEWHNAHDYAKGVQSTGAGPTSTPETRRESGPMKLSGLTFVKDKAAIGGSNPGILGKDKAGNEWLVKGTNKGDIEGPPGGAARNEVLASRLYNAAGAVAPEMRLVDVDTPGGVDKLKTETAVASKMMDVKPFKASNPAHVEAAKKDFAIDAWLGAYDTLGMHNDNVMVAKDGSVVRIDPGGTMFYRAQGGLKKFTKDATEWDTMRGPTKDFNPGQTPSTWPIFGKMTDSELKASAEKLKNIDDATIKALVDKHGPTSVSKAELTDILIARKQDILKRAGLTDEAPPKGDNADLMGLFLGPENGGVDAPAAAATGIPKPKVFGDKKVADADAIHAALQAGDADAIASYKAKTVFGDTYQAAALVALGAGDKQIELSDSGIKFKANEIWDGNSGKNTDLIIEQLGDPKTWIKTPAQAAQAGVSLPKKPAFDRDNDYFLGVKVDNLEAAAKSGDTGTAAKHAADIVTTWESVKNSGDPSPALTAASNYAKATMAALGIAEDGSKIEPKAPDAPLTKPRAPKTASTEVAQQLKTLDDIVSENPGAKVVSNYLASVANPKTTDYAPEVKAYAKSLLDYQKAGGDLWADASPKTAPALPNKLPSTKKSELPQPTKYGLSLSDPIGTALLDLASSGEYGTLKNVDLGTLPDSMKQYKQALLSTLEGKWGNQYGSGTGAGTASVTQTATTALGSQVRAKSAAKTALPDFDSYLILTSNTNSETHNKKIQAIKQAAQAGDVNSILAMSFGSNNYAQKQLKVANDALAALGSDYTVTTSQKKGTHPGLSATVEGKKTAQTVKAQAEAAKAAKPKPKFDPAKITAPPDFTNWNGGGKGLSSVAAINEANNKAVQDIYTLALKGSRHQIKDAKFAEINKETGQFTGKLKSYAEHPSQHVSTYWTNLVNEIDLQLNPPRPVTLGEIVKGDSWDGGFATFKSLPSGKAVAAVPKDQKAGDYIVLGKVRPPFKTPQADDSVISTSAWKQMAKTHYQNAPQAARSTFENTYISTSGAGKLNGSLRSGNLSKVVNQKSVHQHIKDFDNLLVDIPEGSTFTRSMGENGYGDKPVPDKIKALQQWLMTAEKGTIVQEPGFSSTSWTGGNSVLSNNDILWRFTAGKGVRMFPAWLGANAGEGEGLLPPNQRYQILGAKKVGKTVEIDAILLPTFANT